MKGGDALKHFFSINIVSINRVLRLLGYLTPMGLECSQTMVGWLVILSFRLYHVQILQSMVMARKLAHFVL